MLRHSVLTIMLATLAAWPVSARSQCTPAWIEQFPNTGFDSDVLSAIMFDFDGDGPQPARLCAGGGFSLAGGVPVDGAVYWDGVAWRQLGNNVSSVYAFAVFDEDGPGPGPAHLYAAGSFIFGDGVCKWDGANWSPVGMPANGTVLCLHVHDEDGDGPLPATLFAGGVFSDWGRRIARWNGTAWVPVGRNVGAVSAIGVLASFDEDGPGPLPALLYAGGQFTNIGGTFAANIARWNGTAWSALAGGTNGGVGSLQPFDPDGPGPAPLHLLVGGSFSLANGMSSGGLAQWDGASWSLLPGTSTIDRVDCLREHDDGSGPAVFVAGRFSQVDGQTANNIAKWNGSSWAPVGAGLQPTSSTEPGARIMVSDISSTPAVLHVFGGFIAAGGLPAGRFAQWIAGQWHIPNKGVSPCFVPPPCFTNVAALHAWDRDGSGPEQPVLVAGGLFTLAGSTPANNIAIWNGQDWAVLASGVNSQVSAITSFDEDGTGPAPPSLFVAGSFTTAGGTPAVGVARWDGVSWSAVGSQTASVRPFRLNALLVADDGSGPALYAAGWFIINGSDWQAVAKWTGAAWIAIGPPLVSASNGTVRALAAADIDGGGPEPFSIFAGGHFTSVAGTTLNNLARWDGTSWSAVSGGVTTTVSIANVSSLKVFGGERAGLGSLALYVGGNFSSAGEVEASAIAKWDGHIWRALAFGMQGTPGVAPEVDSLEILDPGAGAGPLLFAGGRFASAGGAPSTANLAKWDGTAWSSMGGTLQSTCQALITHDVDGAGPLPPSLFAGGDFRSAGGLSAGQIARWGCAAAPCPADIAGGNHSVDVDDLLLIITSWGRCPAPPALCPADINHSGAVNVDDLLAVITAWGPCP